MVSGEVYLAQLSLTLEGRVRSAFSKQTTCLPNLSTTEAAVPVTC
jgi:hypothetical protein